MSKKEIIERILEEYSKYGLCRIEVEIAYLLAVLWRVPKESIYSGMRIIFNNVYGIKDDKPQIDGGKALSASALNEVRKENPSASDSDIANSMEYVGIDTLEASLEDIDFTLLDKVKESMLQCTNQFARENI